MKKTVPINFDLLNDATMTVIIVYNINWNVMCQRQAVVVDTHNIFLEFSCTATKKSRLLSLIVDIVSHRIAIWFHCSGKVIVSWWIRYIVHNNELMYLVQHSVGRFCQRRDSTRANNAHPFFIHYVEEVIIELNDVICKFLTSTKAIEIRNVLVSPYLANADEHQTTFIKLWGILRNFKCTLIAIMVVYICIG